MNNSKETSLYEKTKNLTQKGSNPDMTTVFSTKAMVRFWLLGALFVCIGYWFYQSLDFIYMIISALIIAFSIEGIVLTVEKKLKSRGVAIGIAYFFLLLFVLSGIVVIIPFLLSQISVLIAWISKMVVVVRDFVIGNTRPDAINQISWLPGFVREYLITHWADFNRSNTEFQTRVLSSLNSLLETSTSSLKNFSLSMFSAIGSFFGILANLTIVFTLAVFFSIEKKYLVNLVVRTSSPKVRSQAQKKIDSVYHKLSLRLKARIQLSLFVIVAMYIAFWILKWCGLELPHMFTLSLLTGLLDIIPYVGPLFSIIPVLLLALIYHGFW